MKRVFDKCSVCGDYGFLDTHRCPPSWLVFFDDGDHDEESAWKIYARDAKEAAEIFVERWEAHFAEYYVADGDEVDVIVVSTITDEKQAYTVRGEMRPHYSASQPRPIVA